MINQAPGIAAVIFDLDGLLIDTEPLWQRSEVEVFRRLGVPLTVEMCHESVGMRVDDVVAYWRERYPWREPSSAEVADELVARIAELAAQEGEPMPGAIDAVALCRARGLPVAIATSAPHVLLDAALGRLGIGDRFAVQCSAQDQDYGKPHPAVYLAAARLLGVPPEQCLAFEDSITGLISAKAARMRVIAVPYLHWKNDPRFVLADEVLDSLALLTAELLERMRSNSSQ